MANSKDGIILKSDVVSLIYSYIRTYITNNGKHETVTFIYKILDEIEGMPVREAHWLRNSDGSWECSHCGYRFFNGTGRWRNHCDDCGYSMV